MDIAKVEGQKMHKEHSMGGVTINFKDKNHMSQTCQAKGKGHEGPVTFDYKRVR